MWKQKILLIACGQINRTTHPVGMRREKEGKMYYTDCEILYYNKRKPPKQRTFHKNINDLFKEEGRIEYIGKKIIPSWLGIKNVTITKEK